LHCFRRIVSYLSKTICLTHVYLASSMSTTEFSPVSLVLENDVLRLPRVVDCVVVHAVVLVEYQFVRDRRTDRRTPGISVYRASIASRGKNS